MRTKTATREETFLELLANKAARMLSAYNVTVQHAKYAVRIVEETDCYIVEFSNQRGKYKLNLWIEKLSLVDRLHVMVSEVLFETTVRVDRVLTEYFIPIKELSEQGLSDGVILACLEANTAKIQRALDGKEIYW